MYTLRKIVDNIQHNQLLGDSYQVIERVSNYDKFAEAFRNLFGVSHVADIDSESTTEMKTCHIIIACKNGQELIPLYENQQSYIMTDTGKTFSNLSFKNK